MAELGLAEPLREADGYGWGKTDAAEFHEASEKPKLPIEAEELPVLDGPKGQAPLVLQAYHELSPLFDEMDAALEQLQLREQGNWRAQLDSGAVIELGHGSLAEVQARTRRFIDTVMQVSSRFGRDVESADLRYASGYALKLRGVTTGDVGEKVDQKKKR